MTTATPAKAALIDFQFTTASGGTGTFTLNTDTKAASIPVILDPSMPEVVGIIYPEAISNYSFSSSYLTFNNFTADWVVAPSITSDFIGLPPEVRGVLSGSTYPSRCTTPPNFTCLLDVAVIYSGNLADSVLSDEPLSYSTVLGIDFYDLTAGELGLREDIVSSQVVRSQAVPESNYSSSIFASGIACWWWLRKRCLRHA